MNSNKAVINFGFNNDDYNRSLLDFLSFETISRLPLEDFQIDDMADVLIWPIISKRELPGWLFVKHVDRIDWPIFIQNGYAKDINYLLKIRDTLNKYRDIFQKTEVKRLYYNSTFISLFPELIDWKWCAKYIKLSDYILLQCWHKFPITTLCQYQNFSKYIIEKKTHSIVWEYTSQRPLSMDIIKEYYYMIDWNKACRYQQLDEAFIADFKDKLNDNCRKLIAQYQNLSDSFIEQNMDWLPMSEVCMYQNLGFDFLYNNADKLDFDALYHNQHYNGKNTIQVVRHNDKLFIIDIESLTNSYIHVDLSDPFI